MHKLRGLQEGRKVFDGSRQSKRNLGPCHSVTVAMKLEILASHINIALKTNDGARLATLLSYQDEHCDALFMANPGVTVRPQSENQRTS